MIYKSYIIEENLDKVHNRMFLFFGENEGLQDQIKKKIKQKYNQNEIINYEQEEILKNENIIFNEILNISLFDKKKTFIINNVTDKMIFLIEEIEKIIDEQQILFFGDLLDKKSKVRNFFERSEKHVAVACYEDNEITIKKIIISELKEFEGISSYNINLILENSGLNRIKLFNELEKVKTFFKNKKIETEKLEILLDNKINDNFNILKDFALMGNKQKTNKLLSETTLEVEKNIYYLNVINQRLMKLIDIIKIKRESSIETVVNNFKPPIFWKDKPNFIVQAKRWSLEKLKLVQKKTYDLEFRIKSGANINANTLLKALIVDICNVANS